MGEQYVSFKTAKMLKEVEFDERCRLSYYVCGGTCVMEGRNSDLPPRYISCPTQALAARWLREVHGIHVSPEIEVYPVYKEGKEVGQRTAWGYYIIPVESGYPIESKYGGEEYETHETALEAGLQEAIKLIKSKDYEAN